MATRSILTGFAGLPLYVAMIFPLSAFWVVVLAIPAMLGFALYLIRQKMLGEPIKIVGCAIYGLSQPFWLSCSGDLAGYRPSLGVFATGAGDIGQWIGPVIAGGMVGSLCLFVDRWIDPYCSAQSSPDGFARY